MHVYNMHVFFVVWFHLYWAKLSCTLCDEQICKIVREKHSIRITYNWGNFCSKHSNTNTLTLKSEQFFKNAHS